jgi:O-antigen/teichoic acid export membrane protein
MIKIRNLKRLLFENLDTKQTIFKNTFWLAMAEGITRLLKLILIIFIARILGASQYGKFAFALAFVSLFAMISDFGISQILTREFAKDRQKEKYFSSLLSLKIFLSFLTLSLIIGFSLLITQDLRVRIIIWLLSLMVVFRSFREAFFAFLRARQRMQYEAWTRITEAVLVTILGFLVLWRFRSLINLSFSYLLAAFLSLILISFFFHKKVFSLSYNFDFSVWKTFLKLSWPLAFVGIFSVVYNQIDSVMMGYWGQIIETGWYNAAYGIIKATLIPVFLIGQVFFPTLSIAFKESKEKFQKIWLSFFRITVFLAIPLVVGGISLASRIIVFIYDPSFLPSVFAFRILIAMTGILYLNASLSRALIVANLEKKVFWITFFAAFLNIILNFIFIPRYSLYGAAFSTLLTFLLIFFLFLRVALKFISVNLFPWRIFLSLIGSVLASALMYYIIFLPSIYRLHLILLILIGGAVYALALLFMSILLRYLISLKRVKI